MTVADRVHFKDFKVHDNKLSWTLKDSMRNTAALAGIHDSHFLYLIEAEMDSVSDFELPGEGTWSQSGGRIQGIGGGAAQWYRLYHSIDVPASFVATFTKHSGATGGFTCCGGKYVVYWGANYTAIAELDADGAPVEVIGYAPSYVIGDDIEISVAVRYQSNVDFDVVDWVTISVYALGRHLLGAASRTAEPSGSEIGFAVYGSDTALFDNLRVPELHSVSEWTSVDPGETIGTGMNRAIGTTPVYYFSRYDGTMRAWLPDDRELDWAIPTSRVTLSEEKKNLMVPAHVRTVGAFHEADEWDQDTLEKQGRATFGMLDDPNLDSQPETYEGSRRGYRRARSQARTWSIDIPGTPLIEPQDRLSYDGDDMRVESVQFRVVKTDEGALEFPMTLECSEYTES